MIGPTLATVGSVRLRREIGSGVTRPEPGEDLIADRAASRRKFVETGVAAKKFRPSPRPGGLLRQVRDVCDAEIHRDASDQRAATPGDDHLGPLPFAGGPRAARQAVGIA